MFVFIFSFLQYTRSNPVVLQALWLGYCDNLFFLI
nr:MAG TPA: hypothetical protein [Caudoviricetes sp.]